MRVFLLKTPGHLLTPVTQPAPLRAHIRVKMIPFPDMLQAAQALLCLLTWVLAVTSAQQPLLLLLPTSFLFVVDKWSEGVDSWSISTLYFPCHLPHYIQVFCLITISSHQDFISYPLKTNPTLVLFLQLLPDQVERLRQVNLMDFYTFCRFISE